MRTSVKLESVGVTSVLNNLAQAVRKERTHVPGANLNRICRYVGQLLDRPALRGLQMGLRTKLIRDVVRTSGCRGIGFAAIQ